MSAGSSSSFGLSLRPGCQPPANGMTATSASGAGGTGGGAAGFDAGWESNRGSDAKADTRGSGGAGGGATTGGVYVRWRLSTISAIDVISVRGGATGSGAMSREGAAERRQGRQAGSRPNMDR